MVPAALVGGSVGPMEGGRRSGIIFLQIFDASKSKNKIL